MKNGQLSAISQSRHGWPVSSDPRDAKMECQETAYRAMTLRTSINLPQSDRRGPQPADRMWNPGRMTLGEPGMAMAWLET